MTAEDAIHAVMKAFEASNLPYMVVGSFAVNLYAIPRSTQDIDLVVNLKGRSLNELTRHLPESFTMDPQVTIEPVSSNPRTDLYVYDIPYRVELFDLGPDPFEQERFKRRVHLDFEQFSAWVATPEDVVVAKIRWFQEGQRGKHYEDARNMIAVQGDSLDWGYIESWCEQHGTLEALDGVRESIPAL
jgi:hypothetical protein